MSDSFQCGDRVTVTGVRATIRFIGSTQFAEGEWIGVELDEEKGKNNGSVQGVRYFECPAQTGMFVRKTALTLLEPTTPTSPARRKSGKKKSLTSRKSASSTSQESDSPNSLPSSPSSASPPKRQSLFNPGRRQSAAFEADISLSDTDEIMERVRGMGTQVAKLEQIIKSLSTRLDDAAVLETVYATPPEIFDKAPSELTPDLEPLLADAADRLAGQFEERLNYILEEQLREAMEPQINAIEEMLGRQAAE